jgi:Rieske Fe-S protein
VLTRRELALLTIAAPLSGCAGAPRPPGDGRRWFDVAATSDISGDWVEHRLQAEGLPAIPVYARRDGDRIVVLSQRCTHLGCPVRYVGATRRFICPCHGGVFDVRGQPTGGPPKQRLERFAVRERDGRVQVAWPPS